MNGRIKLIALDLDGTTINNDRVISARNRRAMAKAAEKGVRIVIATGRPFSALPSDIFKIEAVRYVLTSNGASITDLKTKEVFYENCIAPETVEKAVEFLKNYDYILEGFVKGEAYIERWYYEEIKKTGKSFRDVEYILRTRKPVGSLYDFMIENKHVMENININFENLEEKPCIKEKLLKLPNATITSSFKHNLEIGGETTSKAEALRSLGEKLGIEPGEMMAIGDSPNDIEMLISSGISIAVANAEEEVKAVADHIVPSNHEDGVAHAIEKFAIQC